MIWIKKNVNGYLHPLNHFDVCYSNTSTYKLGINHKVDVEEFVDILDVSTNCFFLTKLNQKYNNTAPP